MRKKRQKCKKALGPDRTCGKLAVAEVRSKGQWHGICYQHVFEFFGLLRFLGEGQSRPKCRSRAA